MDTIFDNTRVHDMPAELGQSSSDEPASVSATTMNGTSIEGFSNMLQA